MNQKLLRISAIFVGIVIFVVIAYMGFRIFGARASNVIPDSVDIQPVNENSVKISWKTDERTIGAVKYGTSEGALNFYAPETIKDIANEHMVELTLLTPGQLYYFEINIGDQTFRNGAVPWTFTTSGKSSSGKTVANPTEAAGEVLQVTLKPQRVTIPDNSGSVQTVCSETDCEKIKSKLGQGCSVTDLSKNNCL